jgi:hypothetical protein
MPSVSVFLGRDCPRSAVAGLLVVAIAGVAYATAVAASATAGNAAHLPGYVGVVAAGAVVAAGIAAWNDGVVTSVLAVVAPAFAWQYHHLANAVVTGTPAFDAVGLPALVGVPIGTTAYALGRVAATDGDAADTEAAIGVLVGSRPRATARAVALAALVAVAGVALAVAVPTTPSRVGPVAATASLTLLAVWTASRGSGLVPSWLLVGVPLASAGAVEWAVTDAQGGVAGAVGGVGFPATVVALGAGTVAFAAGRILGRVRGGEASAPV